MRLHLHIVSLNAIEFAYSSCLHCILCKQWLPIKNAEQRVTARKEESARVHVIRYS
jgi:hypothetical protein